VAVEAVGEYLERAMVFQFAVSLAQPKHDRAIGDALAFPHQHDHVAEVVEALGCGSSGFGGDLPPPDRARVGCGSGRDVGIGESDASPR
jgi:hypothetical protein